MRGPRESTIFPNSGEVKAVPTFVNKKLSQKWVLLSCKTLRKHETARRYPNNIQTGYVMHLNVLQVVVNKLWKEVRQGNDPFKQSGWMDEAHPSTPKSS